MKKSDFRKIIREEIKKIIENPDFVKKEKAFFSDKDAIAFGVSKTDNKMYISEWGDYHGGVETPENIFGSVTRGDFNYPGRLWKNKKLISFWRYPQSKSILLKLVRQLNDCLKNKANISKEPEYNFKIDSSWKIDIISPETSKPAQIYIKDYTESYYNSWSEYYTDFPQMQDVDYEGV